MAWTTALIAAACGGAGMVLLALGIRGRRVDDHPVCRRCGFDLHGLHPGTEACPECGAGLGGRRAVRIGRRRLRRGCIAAGGALLAAAAGMAGLRAAGIDVNDYKPTWWLVAIDLHRPAGATLDAAVMELAERIKGGSVNAATLNAIADRILALQADAAAGWSDALGDLFEQIWAGGGVSDEQALRYMKQSLELSVEVDPPFEAFSTPLSACLTRPRAARKPVEDIPLLLAFEGGRLFGPEGPVEFGGSDSACVLTTARRDYGRVGFVGAWTIRAEVPVGRYPVELRFRLRYDLGLSEEFPPGRSALTALRLSHPPRRDDLPCIEWTLTVPATAQILDRDLQVVELVGQPEYAEGVRKSVTVERLTITEAAPTGDAFVHGFVQIGEPPVGVEGYIVLRQGGREWALKHLRLTGVPAVPRLRRDPYSEYISVQLPGLVPGPVEVVLRPDPKPVTWARAFRARGGPVPVWGEEIVVPTVIEPSGAER